MSYTRNLCIGVSKKCIYADSIHMHTLINGISVVLKLAEFDSSFKLPDCDELDTKSVAHIQRRNTTCCPECKCGASGEGGSQKSFKLKSSKKISSLKESAVSIIKPKEKKACKQKKSYCVFKRSNIESEPVKKMKVEESIIKEPSRSSSPPVQPKKHSSRRPSRKDSSPPVQKKYSSKRRSRSSSPSVQPKKLSSKRPSRSSSPPVQPKKHSSRRPSRNDSSPPVQKKYSSKRRSRSSSPPVQPKKLSSTREKEESDARKTFCKKYKEVCTPKKVKKIKKRKQECDPVFVDTGTSTCSGSQVQQSVKQYNVMHKEKTGFEMYNRMGPISGDTEKTIYSFDTGNISSFEGNPMDNNDSDEVKYRYIACHLKEGTTPDSLLTSTSKSTTETRDCLEATQSIYAPSVCSMGPHRFDESQEILSTIVDHASATKDHTKS